MKIVKYGKLRRQLITKIQKALQGIFLFVIIILLIAQILVSNRYAVSGSKLNELEKQIHAVSDNSELLREKIASASALSTLRTKAADMGYNRKVLPVFLTKELPVALKLK